MVEKSTPSETPESKDALARETVEVVAWACGEATVAIPTVSAAAATDAITDRRCGRDVVNSTSF